LQLEPEVAAELDDAVEKVETWQHEQAEAAGVSHGTWFNEARDAGLAALHQTIEDTAESIGLSAAQLLTQTMSFMQTTSEDADLLGVSQVR
jgi:hypothetical protein